MFLIAEKKVLWAEFILDWDTWVGKYSIFKIIKQLRGYMSVSGYTSDYLGEYKQVS